MDYFISDLHLGHSNIIKMCNRPFMTVDEMDYAIINNWNSRVTNNDDVYILGDVSYKGTIDIITVLNNLNGRKHLIVGNHDRKNLKNPEFRKCFVEIEDMKLLKYSDKTLILCHYPLLEWDGYFRGFWHIYGHIHNNTTNKAYQYIKNEEKALNAGCDITGYIPVTFDELVICNKNFKFQN